MRRQLRCGMVTDDFMRAVAAATSAAGGSAREDNHD
jgi:hypothetical protein